MKGTTNAQADEIKVKDYAFQMTNAYYRYANSATTGSSHYSYAFIGKFKASDTQKLEEIQSILSDFTNNRILAIYSRMENSSTEQSPFTVEDTYLSTRTPTNGNVGFTHYGGMYTAYENAISKKFRITSLMSSGGSFNCFYKSSKVSNYDNIPNNTWFDMLGVEGRSSDTAPTINRPYRRVAVKIIYVPVGGGLTESLISCVRPMEVCA